MFPEGTCSSGAACCRSRQGLAQAEVPRVPIVCSSYFGPDLNH